ncbi:MAG TPA: PRTRC system protein E, partial [Edaphobacter sp.]
MFRELKPLLAKRSLVLTLSSIGDDQLRITITPRPTGKDEAKELAQPFAVEGTAEELDADLPAAIVTYTAEHMTLERSLAQVRANMEAALKEAKDEADKKVAERVAAAKKGSKTAPTSTKPELARPEVKKPEPASLFDTPTSDVSSTASVDGKEESTDSSDEDGTDEPEEADPAAAETPFSPVAATSAGAADAMKQVSIFDTLSEEEEILKEAFDGTEDSSV